MKKIFSKILILLCFLFSLNSFLVLGDIQLPKPSNNFYVYDEANVLSNETKNYIIKTNEILYKKTGAQIVVATVNSLQNYDIESYSLNLFRSWKIGNKDKNNGILLLASIPDKKVRIEVGYGLEGTIPDSKAGIILDNYLIPEFKTGNYDNGFLESYKVILSLAQKEYNINIDGNISSENYDLDSNAEKPNIGTLILIIIGFIIFFLDLIFNHGRLTRALSRAIIYSSRNNGGGFGGGSGGGNSGGGGSSGGGGASRGW